MAIDWTILLPGFPLSSKRGALGWCTVTLLRSEGRKILIDTGSFGDRHLLLSRLEEEGVPPQTVDAVLLTHFHFDHVLNFDLFENAVFRISEQEMTYVAEGSFRQAEDPYVPYAIFDKMEPLIETFAADAIVEPGIQAVALPGHTPGLCGFLLQEERVLVAGDGVKNAREFIRGEPPPTFGRQAEALASYRRAVSLSSIIIPGHDRPFRVTPGNQIEYMQDFSTEIVSAGDPDLPLRIISLP